MLLDDCRDFACPSLRHLVCATGACEVEPTRAVVHFVYRFRQVRKVLTVVVAVQEHRSFGWNERGTNRVEHDPDLHVGRVCRVTDTDWVIEINAAEVVF